MRVRLKANDNPPIEVEDERGRSLLETGLYVLVEDEPDDPQDDPPKKRKRAA